MTVIDVNKEINGWEKFIKQVGNDEHVRPLDIIHSLEEATKFEIVFCKDCANRVPCYDDNGLVCIKCYCICAGKGIVVEPDFFCGIGRQCR